MASVDRTASFERLTLPWWVWPLALIGAAVMAFEIGLGTPGLATWLPFAATTTATVVLLVWLGRIKVGRDGDTFVVDDASLPVRHIDRVEALSGIALRDALSVGLHPLAFVVQRPWVKSAVRVWLDDPDDPTPYWIVSTRRPERLRELLTAEGRESEPEPHPSTA